MLSADTQNVRIKSLMRIRLPVNLSRKVAASAKLLHQFKKHGVRLFIVAMPELAASAHDTFTLNMLAAFAEFERDMIADRIRDVRAGLIARGQRIAGVCQTATPPTPPRGN